MLKSRFQTMDHYDEDSPLILSVPEEDEVRCSCYFLLCVGHLMLAGRLALPMPLAWLLMRCTSPALFVYDRSAFHIIFSRFRMLI
jgi:hypothetical protein